ncbi:bifunctional UDP-N-acetylglucosamine diphosphorylase/glucosamine-1-phosphate N-acetyltransferase GlmU [Hyphomicrobium sp. CS1BSMeth3]|uniref:bifunctional UDP-N-acetylglucosamine diphosphorylase/glucosamine-1-phosphate N-acetyltransferase GlmU n=1 Tax=Hyphomicrobium sp. CS1BSMeth3 TaxID=1892844 RepID=UPI000931CF53|nr:bifunctional UDP-N-acetylglucosamine diphosphorylase/glucosamine-1-phosphate N-acetyltransferase GlmU [Hyphomicrobium sp. CS1BSMeth3]
MPAPLLTVVLAAGLGTRMRSATPKVLHKIAGRTMLGHVLDAVRVMTPERLALVVGPGMEDVAAEGRAAAPAVETYIQAERRGTADAVLAAAAALDGHAGDVMVLYGDTPLLTPETLSRMRAALEQGAGVVVLGFEAADPTGYGRLLTDAGGGLVAIREHADASEAERQIRLCNSGVMAFRVRGLAALLRRIGSSNAKGELYLTDAVELARSDGYAARVVVCSEEEVLGINDRSQLAAAEAIWQRRRRIEAMRNGASLVAPETVWLSYDTMIGRDVLIEPNVVIGPGVTIEDRVTIRANCHIVGIHGKDRAGLRIREGAIIGPFARLRPGADIGTDVHVGNFVEVKNAVMEAGAKANHLAYIGDGRVGADANIGAGTIFCNYDGYEKHHTDVGAGAFVGSNSALVAPVKIGDGAYVGSGSVITKDVPADALAVGRAPQETREGWAAKYRARRQRRK